MRKTFLLAALTLSCTAAASALAGDDDLFSRVRLESTVGSGDSTDPFAPSSRPENRNMTGVNGLQAVLLAAGYTARMQDKQTVTTEVFRSDWSASLTITLDDEARQLRLAMPLTSPETNTVIAPKTLRALLEANRQNWGAFFSITGDPQRIELLQTIPSTDLDSGDLRTRLEAMAEMAVKTRDIWNVEGVRIRQAETQTVSTAPSPATPAASPAAATAPSLTGKWIASPTKTEAFALQLDSGGTFRLVHVKDSKSTKSKGTFSLTDTTLALKGDDGTTLNGTLTRQSDGFTLSLGKAGSKGVTLNFKSSTS